MKNITNIFLMLSITLFTFNCSDDDDGTSTTGNTQEYFKYTIEGVERIFDYDVEAHLETDTGSIIDRYEINASGISANETVRRIGASFSFDSNGPFMPNTMYNWGLALDSDTTEKFYFAESTVSNLFILSADFSMHPITATLISTVPSSVGDYLEFTFTGNFDDNGTTKTISGECRVQRDADQNF